MSRKHEDESITAYIDEFITPQVNAHKAEHERLRQGLTDVENDYRKLTREIAELRAKCTAQARQMAVLQASYAAQAEQLADLDRRFTYIAGEWSSKFRPDKQTEDDNRHHDLAAEYERFQRNEVFALVISPTTDGSILDAASQALAYARLNHALFAQDGPEPGALHATLSQFGIDYPHADLAELCRQAADITARAAKLGRSQRWDFGLGDGRFAPARQARWTGSASGEPDEVVAFVVAPGYTVGDGRVVIRQQVFTTRAASPGTSQQPTRMPGSGQVN